MVKREIIIKKPTKRAYGNEYPIVFKRNGRVVHKTVVSGNDLRYIKRSYTKEFQDKDVKVKRTYGKKKK